MIEPAFRTLLIAAVGLAALVKPGAMTAGGAAIALSAITTRAEEEHGAAFLVLANPQKKNYFAIVRHACGRTQLDKGNAFVAP
jgi:hypothetical protein